MIVYVHNPDAYDTPSPPDQWVIDVGPDEREELVKRFAGWGPEVQMLIRVCERKSDMASLGPIPTIFLLKPQELAKPTRWALHIVRRLPHFVSGSVAVLGDAVSLNISELVSADRSASYIGSCDGTSLWGRGRSSH